MTGFIGPVADVMSSPTQDGEDHKKRKNKISFCQDSTVVQAVGSEDVLSRRGNGIGVGEAKKAGCAGALDRFGAAE